MRLVGALHIPKATGIVTLLPLQCFPVPRVAALVAFVHPKAAATAQLAPGTESRALQLVTRSYQVGGHRY